MKLSKLSLLDLQKTQNYAQSIVSMHICRPPHVFFHEGNSNKLFVSYTSNSIDKSPASVARWIRTFLTEAGIDTSVFKTYSNANAFVPVQEFVKMVDWSNVSILLL